MNEKNIQTVALEEIWKNNTDGHVPILLEIYNPDIKWNDGSLEQEDLYLRVINDSNPVVYKGNKYLPCCFEYTPPEENGKSIGPATISLSAIDSRVVQMLRSIELQCDVTVVAAFAKMVRTNDNNEESLTYMFYPMDQFKSKMQSATYSKSVAQLNLVFNDVLKLNVPRDVATKNKLPSVNPNA